MRLLVLSLPEHARCRAIEAAADGCGSDVGGLSFWWSNCLHLRWMLWAMSRGEGEGTLDEFDWVMQACGGNVSFVTLFSTGSIRSVCFFV